MALPKGKLLALVAVFAAIGIAAGTGAFTTVQAERTADVGVAGDSSALVAIEATTTANGEYLDNENDQAQIDLTETSAASGGTGLNQRAETNIKNVFTITNQGTQTVEISISKSGGNPEHVAFYTLDQEAAEAEASSFTGGDLIGSDGSTDDKIDLAGAVSDGDSDGSDNPARLDGNGNTIALDAGESVTVSIFVDTTANDLSTSAGLLNTVTITADASNAPSSGTDPDGDGSIGSNQS